MVEDGGRGEDVVQDGGHGEDALQDGGRGGRGEGRAEDALQDGEGPGPDDLPGGGDMHGGVDVVMEMLEAEASDVEMERNPPYVRAPRRGLRLAAGGDAAWSRGESASEVEERARGGAARRAGGGGGGGGGAGGGGGGGGAGGRPEAEAGQH